MPRIVILCSGDDFAERLVVRLGVRGVLPDAVLVVPNQNVRRDGLTSLLRRPRRFTRSLVQRALEGMTAQVSPTERFAGLTPHCEALGSLNGADTEAALRRLEPDYLILAGTGGVGILKEHLLAIPKRGTINAHPALLPWVRGMRCVERSLERGVAVGASVHYVDPGIDTGAVIRRALVPVFPADTRASLRSKAFERGSGLLLETVLAVARGEHPESVAQAQRFPYSKRTPLEEAMRSEVAIRRGRAVELYTLWRAHYDSDEIPVDRLDCPPLAIEPLPPVAAQAQGDAVR